VLVDGETLDAPRLAELRGETAWVDPAVHLWNESLFDNLRYGDRGTILSSIGSIIEEADLGQILEKLPAGLQSPLGEGGRLTSGGEGQRIRFGRALVRQPVRLAVLDEPFRGLDRQQRHDLLSRAREVWRHQTMLCVTHDIQETLSFTRVLVLQEGRVVEDGDPAELSQASDSVYAALLKAERAVQTTLWADGRWRRWRLEDGGICEDNFLLEPSWTAERHISRGR
jgi:ATP-binding cassette subfamily B protein